MGAIEKQKSLDDYLLSSYKSLVRLQNENDQSLSGANPISVSHSEHYYVSERQEVVRTSSWLSIEPAGFFEKAYSYGSMGKYCVRIEFAKVLNSYHRGGTALQLITPFRYGNAKEGKKISFFVNNIDWGTAEAISNAANLAIEENPDCEVIASLLSWKKQNSGHNSSSYPFNMSSTYSMSNLLLYLSEKRVKDGEEVISHRIYPALLRR
ncbi:MAG: hypothetical protein ACP5MZ_04375 [Candidatus Micrarchaeia archaeon]